MINSIPISAFSDNYIWLLQPSADRIASNTYIAVDPGDGEPVRKFLHAQHANLSHILITHHHSDHIGGVRDLKNEFDCKVIGPRDHRIDGLDEIVTKGTRFEIEKFGEFQVIETPGHTSSHIAYMIDNKLFCGDTLFSMGCGRIFDGSAEQLFRSLQLIATLPINTQIYCSHEYTLSNSKFAQVLEPKNRKLIAHIQKIKKLRDNNLPTIPSTIEIELNCNPFLRLHSAAIKQNTERFVGKKLKSEFETFAALRTWKDQFSVTHTG